MKVRLIIVGILIILFGTTLLNGEKGRSATFIVTGNVRAEFNLCG